MISNFDIKLPRYLQPWRVDLQRVGCRGDGGYLVHLPDIQRTNTLLSLGIGDNWHFEREFEQHHPCSILAYDQPNTTPNPRRDEYFQGHRKLLLTKVGDQGVRISDVIQQCKPPIFLKCDIEGSEFDLFDDLVKHRHWFSGMVIEVHDINDFNKFDIFTDFVSRIGMPLAHLHVNNYFYYLDKEDVIPDTLELTWTASNNAVLDRSLKLPHELDDSNCPDRPQFAISW